MKRLLRIGLLTFSIFFLSCSSEDSEGAKENTISASIDGKEWNGSKILNVSLIKSKDTGEQRFDISAQDNSQMIVMACASDLTNNDAMPLKEYIFDYDFESDEEYTEGDAIFINSYLVDGNTFTEHMVTKGKLTITSMNPASKTVSGTFSFTAKKVGTLQTKIFSPEILEVKSGVFTNLKYTVYNY